MKNGLYIVSASWCQNCKVLKASLDRAGIEYQEIDADSEEGMQFTQENKVKSLPTSFLFKDGEIIKTIIGVKPVSEYAE